MPGESIKSLDNINVLTFQRQDSYNNEESGDAASARGSLKIEKINTKIAIRPHLVLRQSNDDFTNLIKVGPAEDVPSVPDQQVDENQLMTLRNPPKNYYRVLAMCIWLIGCGFSDAAPGALLPFIEEAYGLNYSKASLIWMANAMGFITVAIFAHKIEPLLGKQKTVIFGMSCSVTMYSIVSSGTKFPAIVAAFYLGGIGLACIMSQANVFLARLHNSSKYISICHGAYGVGATVSPLIATAMVTAGAKWNYFFLILLGWMIGILIFMSWSFMGADEDLKKWDTEQSYDVVHENSIASPKTEQMIELGSVHSADGTITPPQVMKNASTELTNRAVMLLAMKTPATWLLSFFVLFYQGAEVSMGGWIVTYLLDYRHGNIDNVGYVASGFWGGMTLGRLLLTHPLYKYIGARRSVIICSITAIIFVILAWVLPHVIASGVCVSIAGVATGPNYSLMLAAMPRLLPRRIQVFAMTIVTAFGSSGGAFFPFIIGLISQYAGAYVVMPAFISMFSVMLILWICLPNIERIGQTKLTLWQRIW